MKIFVTGVGGQLGHDVMNELAGRGYEGIGSDIAPVYSGIQDGTAVTQMPYVPLDITDRASVDQILFGEEADGKTTARRQLDALADDLNDTEIGIIIATARALLDAREKGE